MARCVKLRYTFNIDVTLNINIDVEKSFVDRNNNKIVIAEWTVVFIKKLMTRSLTLVVNDKIIKLEGLAVHLGGWNKQTAKSLP